eukprot:3814092-Prymnesium_polylepis.2
MDREGMAYAEPSCESRNPPHNGEAPMTTKSSRTRPEVFAAYPNREIARAVHGSRAAIRGAAVPRLWHTHWPLGTDAPRCLCPCALPATRRGNRSTLAGSLLLLQLLARRLEDASQKACTRQRATCRIVVQQDALNANVFSRAPNAALLSCCLRNGQQVGGGAPLIALRVVLEPWHAFCRHDPHDTVLDPRNATIHGLSGTCDGVAALECHHDLSAPYRALRNSLRLRCQGTDGRPGDARPLVPHAQVEIDSKDTVFVVLELFDELTA